MGKHKGVKFHCYAENTQVYIHLSQKNSSTAFEKLNRCMDDIKEWMSASKHKLNPDKTEFILFGSKRQRDKLKAYFPSTILGSPLCPAESVLAANALVSSRLDYCNSLFRSLSSIFANYCASKTVQLELYQIPVDTQV